MDLISYGLYRHIIESSLLIAVISLPTDKPSGLPVPIASDVSK